MFTELTLCDWLKLQFLNFLANLKQQSLAAAIRDIFSFLSSIHSFCLYRFEKYNNLRFNLQFDSKHRNSHY
ncbi:hypothetical protein T4B_12675 [Trichinella pseudospiralis]|uniref:Uncharacterized protein n=1 Tax=Trichinella pseudospiralis TaxID=6337 RepID=A0A0V1IFL1_TRIPS|nr:hypothetical protein T4B_12675 [Trichinella pseudospiralis]